MTGRQRAALHALRHGRFVNADYLAATLDTSPQGAVQTVSSLVKRGMCERRLIGGRTHWRLTVLGRDMAALNAQRSAGVR